MMSSLLELPRELLHEILEHLRPVYELPHPLHKPDQRGWDTRHWYRTLAAVARTCRLLNVLAIPRLYSNYEAPLKIPIHAFVDRISSDTSLQKGLTSIVIRHPSGPHCSIYKPTRERISRYHEWIYEEFQESRRYEFNTENADECARLEVWRLVLHAPNLRIFEWTCCSQDVESTSQVESTYQLPLFPIVKAAWRIRDGLENDGWFDQLHTMRVDLGICGFYLARFFHLPSLQRLILRIPNEEYFTKLPEPAPISKVHTLGVECSGMSSSLVVRMIGYCQALQSFSCNRKLNDDDFFNGDKEDAEEWSTNILDALRRHSTTLKRLNLNPFDREMRENSDTGFECPDWRSFEALEFLEISSMMLMGRPPGTMTNGEWSPIGNWQYPSICNVIPPKLKCLELHIHPELTPGDRGFESFLTSGLPSKLNKDSSKVDFSLKRVNMEYVRMKHDRPLPMDFWQVEHAFRNAGLEFEYSVVLDIDDSK